ncbi:MAG: 6-phosphogluconolactonase [Saccharofermentanales bacterium]
MKIHILPNATELGKAAAIQATEILSRCIKDNGTARLLLSTGMSQFETLEALLVQPIDWSCVEMFHLDEYIDLPITHKASFRKYLNERFISKICLKAVYLVDGEGDIAENIRNLNESISKAPVDLGLIGIGENAHVAFNDPPADFDTEQPYIIVNLNEKCKMQQVREGWFPDIKSVPAKAISMSVRQILLCKNIISCVPHSEKANAVRLAIESPVSNLVPATILRTHLAFDLYLDSNSAKDLDKNTIEKLNIEKLNIEK